MLSRACQRSGLAAGSLAPGHVSRLLVDLEPAMRLYLRPRAVRAARDVIRSLGSSQTTTAGAPSHGTSEGADVEILVQRVEDIDTARNAALRLSREAGLGSVTSVKVATVVSELARNIHQYAGEGLILLRALNGTRPGMRVTAQDSGPGIPHLDQVLSGRWRSKHGLGLGLLGTRRLMCSFEIEAAPGQGTKVVVEKYA